MLEIEIENLDTHKVLRPCGEIDAYTVAQFRNALPIWLSSPGFSLIWARCHSWIRRVWVR